MNSLGLTHLKRILQLCLPPLIVEGLRKIRRRSQYVLEYAPQGWQTVLDGSAQDTGWNAAGVISAERSKWEAYCRNVEGTGPLGFSHEHTNLEEVRNVSFHNIHLTYAYILALVAHQKNII